MHIARRRADHYWGVGLQYGDGGAGGVRPVVMNANVGNDVAAGAFQVDALLDGREVAGTQQRL